MTITKRGILWTAAIVFVAAAVFIFATTDPEKRVLFPKCPFHALTGLQCPGCGSQRAIHALLHGQIAKAIGYNGLLVASIPVIGVIAAAEAGRKNHPKFHAAVNSPKTIAVILAVIAAWWIIRNIIGI